MQTYITEVGLRSLARAVQWVASGGEEGESNSLKKHIIDQVAPRLVAAAGAAGVSGGGGALPLRYDAATGRLLLPYVEVDITDFVLPWVTSAVGATADPAARRSNLTASLQVFNVSWEPPWKIFGDRIVLLICEKPSSPDSGAAEDAAAAAGPGSTNSHGAGASGHHDHAGPDEQTTATTASSEGVAADDVAAGPHACGPFAWLESLARRAAAAATGSIAQSGRLTAAVDSAQIIVQLGRRAVRSTLFHVAVEYAGTGSVRVRAESLEASLETSLETSLEQSYRLFQASAVSFTAERDEEKRVWQADISADGCDASFSDCEAILTEWVALAADLRTASSGCREAGGAGTRGLEAAPVAAGASARSIAGSGNFNATSPPPVSDSLAPADGYLVGGAASCLPALPDANDCAVAPFYWVFHGGIKFVRIFLTFPSGTTGPGTHEIKSGTHVHLGLSLTSVHAEYDRRSRRTSLTCAGGAALERVRPARLPPAIDLTSNGRRTINSSDSRAAHAPPLPRADSHESRLSFVSLEDDGRSEEPSSEDAGPGPARLLFELAEEPPLRLLLRPLAAGGLAVNVISAPAVRLVVNDPTAAAYATVIAGAAALADRLKTLYPSRGASLRVQLAAASLSVELAVATSDSTVLARIEATRLLATPGMLHTRGKFTIEGPPGRNPPVLISLDALTVRQVQRLEIAAQVRTAVATASLEQDCRYIPVTRMAEAAATVSRFVAAVLPPPPDVPLLQPLASLELAVGSLDFSLYLRSRHVRVAAQQVRGRGTGGQGCWTWYGSVETAGAHVQEPRATKPRCFLACGPEKTFCMNAKSDDNLEFESLDFEVTGLSLTLEKSGALAWKEFVSYLKPNSTAQLSRSAKDASAAPLYGRTPVTVFATNVAAFLLTDGMRTLCQKEPAACGAPPNGLGGVLVVQLFSSTARVSSLDRQRKRFELTPPGTPAAAVAAGFAPFSALPLAGAHAPRPPPDLIRVAGLQACLVQSAAPSGLPCFAAKFDSVAIRCCSVAALACRLLRDAVSPAVPSRAPPTAPRAKAGGPGPLRRFAYFACDCADVRVDVIRQNLAFRRGAEVTLRIPGEQLPDRRRWGDGRGGKRASCAGGKGSLPLTWTVYGAEPVVATANFHHLRVVQTFSSPAEKVAGSCPAGPAPARGSRSGTCGSRSAAISPKNQSCVAGRNPRLIVSCTQLREWESGGAPLAALRVECHGITVWDVSGGGLRDPPVRFLETAGGPSLDFKFVEFLNARQQAPLSPLARRWRAEPRGSSPWTAEICVAVSPTVRVKCTQRLIQVLRRLSRDFRDVARLASLEFERRSGKSSGGGAVPGQPERQGSGSRWPSPQSALEKLMNSEKWDDMAAAAGDAVAVAAGVGGGAARVSTAPRRSPSPPIDACVRGVHFCTPVSITFDYYASTRLRRGAGSGQGPPGRRRGATHTVHMLLAALGGLRNLRVSLPAAALAQVPLPSYLVPQLPDLDPRRHSRSLEIADDPALDGRLATAALSAQFFAECVFPRLIARPWRGCLDPAALTRSAVLAVRPIRAVRTANWRSALHAASLEVLAAASCLLSSTHSGAIYIDQKSAGAIDRSISRSRRCATSRPPACPRRRCCSATIAAATSLDNVASLEDGSSIDGTRSDASSYVIIEQPLSSGTLDGAEWALLTGDRATRHPKVLRFESLKDVAGSVVLAFRRNLRSPRRKASRSPSAAVFAAYVPLLVLRTTAGFAEACLVALSGLRSSLLGADPQLPLASAVGVFASSSTLSSSSSGAGTPRFRTPPLVTARNGSGDGEESD